MSTNIKQRIERLLRDHQGVLHNRDVARALRVSPQAAHYHLQRLCEEGAIELRGAGRGAHYVVVGASKRVASLSDDQSFQYRTEGLEEHRVWEALERDARALRDVSPDARQILSYATTELVNNAIDHSGAVDVVVRVAREAGGTLLEVRDQGVGAFERVRSAFGLASEEEAVAEISKGKRTTQPSRHTGEGLFFVSKAARYFELESGALRWSVDNERGDMAIGRLDAPLRGTVVRVHVPKTPAKPLLAIFNEFTVDHDFARTRIVVRLFQTGAHFVSRSEARRLLSGLEQFTEVMLDFHGVKEIGQGFADEVFRVWQHAHPRVRLEPRNMIAPVDSMVRRALANRVG